jgi:hypothetical protein
MSAQLQSRGARRFTRRRALPWLLVSTAVLGLALLPASASAAKRTVTLTFDELSFQPVDGVTINGLTFGFSGGDATYGAFGPGSIVNVQDPSLEGSAFGTLRLTFARPTNVLEFGLALNTFGSLTPGATVALYNPGGHLRRVIGVNTSELVSFTEGRFAYSGGAIGSAVITFNSSAASRFALDNLTFEQKGVPRRQASATSSASATAWTG